VHFLDLSSTLSTTLRYFSRLFFSGYVFGLASCQNLTTFFLRLWPLSYHYPLNCAFYRLLFLVDLLAVCPVRISVGNTPLSTPPSIPSPPSGQKSVTCSRCFLWPNGSTPECCAASTPPSHVHPVWPILVVVFSVRPSPRFYMDRGG